MCLRVCWRELRVHFCCPVLKSISNPCLQPSRICFSSLSVSSVFCTNLHWLISWIFYFPMKQQLQGESNFFRPAVLKKYVYEFSGVLEVLRPLKKIASSIKNEKHMNNLMYNFNYIYVSVWGGVFNLHHKMRVCRNQEQSSPSINSLFIQLWISFRRKRKKEYNTIHIVYYSGSLSWCIYYLSEHVSIVTENSLTYAIHRRKSMLVNDSYTHTYRYVLRLLL